MKKVKTKMKTESTVIQNIKEHLKPTKMSYFLKMKARMRIGWSMKCLSMNFVKLKPWFKLLQLIDTWQVIKGIIKETFKETNNNWRMSTTRKCHSRYCSWVEAKTIRKLNSPIRLRFWRINLKLVKSFGMR